MFLWIGLGNPGDKYAMNRHNIGFFVIDEIAKNFSTFDTFRLKFQGQISEGKIEENKIVLLKPQTYMNLSGESAVKCANFYKISPQNIIVFHDELDLSPGEIRVKLGGGNAGHNGLKSLQAHLGTGDFWRIRIGIGRPADKTDVSNYVLGDFYKADILWLKPTIEKLVQNANILSSQGAKAYESAMKEHNKT